jgi:hypothetical protein
VHPEPELMQDVNAIVAEAQVPGRADVIAGLIEAAMTPAPTVPVAVRKQLMDAYATLLQAAQRQPLGLVAVRLILGPAIQKLRDDG